MSPVIDTINFETNYQEILSILNRITDNREISMVCFSVIIIVVLFLGYIAIDFECQMDLTLRIPRDLFLMSVHLFILIILLLKNVFLQLKIK